MLKIRQVEGWTTAINPDPTLTGPRNHRQQVPYDTLHYSSVEMRLYGTSIRWRFRAI